MLVMLLQGFSCGIPLALTGSTLQAWMKDLKIDIGNIGVFSLVGLPYAFKFLWSPLIDRFSPSFLGHRRSWLLIAQLMLALGIASMAFLHPEAPPLIAIKPWGYDVPVPLNPLFLTAVFVAFASASQDIVVDAYRVESLPTEAYAAGLSLYTMGYRVAMITSGAVALSLADHWPWRVVYLAMAGTMLVGIVTTLLVSEPHVQVPRLKTFRESVVEPLVEFLTRRGSLEVLAFLTIYKLDTNLTVAIMTPFFMDVGFTKTDIAAITKVFGMVALILGSFTAGVVMTRWTMLRALVVFGILQAVASVSFMSVAHFGKIYWLLVLAIGTENFFSGMGVAAQGAFMMSLVNKRYTATQYALITSFMALSRYLASGGSGYLVKRVGWEQYYLICAFIGVPGLLMLSRFRKWNFPGALAAPAVVSPATIEEEPESA
jgi:PAT family beta-lactamase induction signal transducer AmpG